MSTSYQTLAKPRGRRDTENADSSTRSRATSEASRVLSKKISRSSDENTPAKRSRPTSPALFMQRSRGIDHQKLSNIEPVSPKSSVPSMKANRQNTPSENEVPMVIPSTRSAIKPPTSMLTATATHPTTQTFEHLAMRSGISRPATPQSKVSDVTGPSRAPNVAPLIQATEDNPSNVSSARIDLPSMPSSLADLQPRVEEAVEDITPTLPPAKSPPNQVADLVKEESLNQTGSRPDDVRPEASFEPSLERSSEPLVTKTMSPSSRSGTPALSPPHSPRLTHYVGYHGQAPVPYSYYPRQMAAPPMYPGSYYNASFSPPAEHRLPPNDGRPRSTDEDDRRLLMEKVSNVIPDINRLLDQYRETHGQLSAKDFLVKQSESLHADQINSLKVELDANKTAYEKVIRSIVGENGQLKREVEQLKAKISTLEKSVEGHVVVKTELARLQTKHRDLTDNVDSVRLSKEQLLADKLSHERQVDSMKKQHVVDKEKHHRSLSELKEQSKQQMAAKAEACAKTLTERDELHTKAVADKDREHSRLLEEKEVRHSQTLAEKEMLHNRILGEQKVILSKVQLELANLITKHSAQKKDLEAIRSSESEQKTRLERKSKELDEAVARHGDELEKLRLTNEEEHLGAVNQHEERYVKMMEDYSSKEREWMQSMDGLRADLQAQKDQSAKHRELHESTKKQQEEQSNRHAELATSMASWKAKHRELQKENENMDLILQGLGHATEVKSKGDEFFIAAFRHVAGLITNLSRDSFHRLPDTAPLEIMLLVPTDIPDFMRKSDSAYELRCMYIQHKIWNVLHARIFEPFLFTLGRVYGGVDTFLSTLSRDIRHKSERREAAWRQTTLRAAFTVSQAKKAINLVATTIVEEILTEIKCFADPDEWATVAVGVQRIVKSAAETWRLARVEREMIASSMPDATEYDGNEWLQPLQEERLERQPPPIFKLPDTMVLRITPHIVRQRVHIEFLPEDNKEANLSSIYLQGLALFSNSRVAIDCHSDSQSQTQLVDRLLV